MDLVTRPFCQQRRHTLAFLSVARQTAHVYLGTSVDMSQVDSLRAKSQEAGVRLGYTAIVAAACARVLKQFPEANSAMLPGPSSVAQFPSVTARIMIDGRAGKQRCVLTAAVTEAEGKSCAAIQAEIEAYLAADPVTSPTFSKLRRLQKLPPRLGAWLLHRLTQSGKGRFRTLGSFSLTSVGRSQVSYILPIIANGVGFGMGRVTPSCVPVGQQVSVRPMMHLSMAFDHRLIDGAMAADILTAVKDTLESTRLVEAESKVESHG